MSFISVTNISFEHNDEGIVEAKVTFEIPYLAELPSKPFYFSEKVQWGPEFTSDIAIKEAKRAFSLRLEYIRKQIIDLDMT